MSWRAGRSRKELTELRIKWLLDNPSDWDQIGTEGLLTRNGSRKTQTQKILVKKMKIAGVVSPTTYWLDIDILALINEIRRRRRNK